MHSCHQCLKTFRYQYNLNRHLKEHDSVYPCPQCGKQFSRKDSLKRHEKQCKEKQGQEKQDQENHPPQKFQCP